MARRQVLIASFICLSAAFPAHASFDLTFKDLATKDYTAMEKLIRQKMGPDVIDDFEREPKVREALKLVLSRRNTDGKRTAMFLQLQGLVPDVYFALSLQKISDEALSLLKSASNNPADDLQKATGLVVLENLMAETRPKLNDFRSTFEVIRDAKIELSEDLKRISKLEGMSENVSPSVLAKRLLEAHPAPKEEGSAVAKNIVDSWD